MSNKPTQCDLFNWQPPTGESAQLISFPLQKRIGRVRDVAWKLFNKPTKKSFDYYQRQTTELLSNQLLSLGQSPEQIQSEIHAFWGEVEQELARLEYSQPKNHQN